MTEQNNDPTTEQKPKKTRRSALDIELDSIREILRALAPLDVTQRERVMSAVDVMLPSETQKARAESEATATE